MSDQILLDKYYSSQEMSLLFASIFQAAFHQKTSKMFCDLVIEDIQNSKLKQYAEACIESLNVRLKAYYNFYQAIIQKKLIDYQELIEILDFHFDEEGNLYGNDLLRLIVGIQTSLSLLDITFSISRNENQVLKCYSMTQGNIPTSDLFSIDSFGSASVGCIPLSKRKKLKEENYQNELLLKYGFDIPHLKRVRK